MITIFSVFLITLKIVFIFVMWSSTFFNFLSSSFSYLYNILTSSFASFNEMFYLICFFVCFRETSTTIIIINHLIYWTFTFFIFFANLFMHFVTSSMCLNKIFSNEQKSLNLLLMSFWKMLKSNNYYSFV